MGSSLRLAALFPACPCRRLVPVMAGLLLSLLAVTAAADGQARRFLVGFAQDTLANDWRSAQVRELREAFAAYPWIELRVTNAQGSTARQIHDIENLVAQGVDLLITSPRDGQATQPAIRDVYRRGIPVVLLTRAVPGDDYSSFVSPDDRAIARRAGRLLATHLQGRGRVLMLTGVPTATTAMHRSEGFRAALSEYPEMRIVAELVGNYLRADALHQMESALSGGLAFDAIFAHSDSMASGARMALRAAGVDPATVPVVAIDYIAEAREAIRAGDQLASFSYPTCAREGAEIAVKILRGEPYPRRLTVPSQRVTGANVDQVEPIF